MREWSLIALGLAGACFSPEIPSGSILCGDAGCPPGMSCGDDGYCTREEGPGPRIDANPGDFPTGAILHFNRGSCPDGWSPLPDAAGRAILALPVQGAAGAAVGQALADLGTRTITEVPTHSHDYSLGTGRTNVENHSHEMLSTTSHDGTGGGCDRVQEVTAASRSVLISAESHSHTVDIPAFSSGAAGQSSVDVTMPYVQLLVCRKN